MSARARACVRACACVCVCARVRVCTCVYTRSAAPYAAVEPVISLPPRRASAEKRTDSSHAIYNCKRYLSQWCKRHLLQWWLQWYMAEKRTVAAPYVVGTGQALIRALIVGTGQAPMPPEHHRRRDLNTEISASRCPPGVHQRRSGRQPHHASSALVRHRYRWNTTDEEIISGEAD
jgi:hypothetical protein